MNTKWQLWIPSQSCEGCRINEWKSVVSSCIYLQLLTFIIVRYCKCASEDKRDDSEDGMFGVCVGQVLYYHCL